MLLFLTAVGYRSSVKHTDTTSLIDNELVKRPNETIGISPSHGGGLTLIVRRLFNVLVHFTVKEGERDVYRKPLREIMRYIDYNSNDTARLKAHLEAMASIPITWNTSTDDDEIWTAAALIAHASVIQPKSRGVAAIVEWSFSSPVRARLLQPAQWTQLKLVMHTKLKTGASIGLYEICSRYLTSPGGRTARKPVEWWMPAIIGDRSEVPSPYKYFKRDVLRPAIAEVNTHADFTVELVEHKIGNKVAELQFVVQKKPVNRVTDEESPPYDGALLERVIRLGIGQEAARRICEKNDSAEILAAIDFTEKRAAKSPPLDSVAAYFRSALKEGYREKKPPQKHQQQQSLPLESEEDTREKLRARFLAHRRREALLLWREMPAQDMLSELDAFLATNPAPMIADAIKRNKLTQKTAETAFTEWFSAKVWGAEPSTDELLAFAMKADINKESGSA
ncbi:replication initiation protein [Robbsia andropogonis]|uniref:replication initiation protein n=1 Tax=Robbsia andropogonis TaxID=28092 RepID=UPI0020A078C8|nr:replication initiation protein [Robbsia andropogonis]MCP1121260.1 replication initiation protein [Robbsia andropogonis]MCP1131053.1 replication initiation protein [Robbsia andropogonis]